MSSILITGGTIITADGERKADMYIEDGIIKTIATKLPTTHYPLPTTQRINAEGKLLFPGFIDSHVHFREPGLMHKGNMQSESRAAIAGGITTVCDMPNTIPPTVTVAALEDKIERAERISDCDIRFFFGATKLEHLAQFREAWKSPDLRRRLVGLKLYFDHSTGDQGADLTVIEEAFRLCAEIDAPVIAHCEDAGINAEAQETVLHALPEGQKSDVSFHSLMRPVAAEVRAMEQAIGFARTYGTKLHIAHLSTAQGLDLVRQAKKDGLSVTCEIAPHHLFLSTNDYETLGALGKMNPPLRTPDQQKALWEGIFDGTVDCIATDHAPHTLSEKHNPDWTKVPGGVPGVETMIPLLMTVVAEQHVMVSSACAELADTSNHDIHLSYSEILRLCFANPNRIFSLGKKGIVEDAPADFVIIDPKEEWTIRGEELHSKCGWTPYDGWRVLGKMIRTSDRGSS
ncbi:MAG: dihydroorotase family protein [Candidatus Peregrinibacteria bacterium]